MCKEAFALNYRPSWLIWLQKTESGTLGTQMVQLAWIGRKLEFSSSERIWNSAYISGNGLLHCPIIYATHHLPKAKQNNHKKHLNKLPYQHFWSSGQSIFSVLHYYLSIRFMLRFLQFVTIAFVFISSKESLRVQSCLFSNCSLTPSHNFLLTSGGSLAVEK